MIAGIDFRAKKHRVHLKPLRVFSLQRLIEKLLRDDLLHGFYISQVVVVGFILIILF